MTNLTRGSLLARNVVWNLLGNGAPLVVAVFCIPVLIHGLGKDRFGVLALAWALIGYASLFDLGLGRALTQLVARKLGAGEERAVPSIVWTSLLLMVLLGLAGTAVVVLAAPYLVERVLGIPAALQAETRRSLYLLALSIPVIIGTAGLRGLLEAYQRFDLINTLRVPMGVFTYAGPLVVLAFSNSLLPIVALLVGGRVVAWVAHLLLCLRVAPALRQRIAWHRPAIGPLLRSGGWMTVSNTIGPLMDRLDRFLIAGLVSVTAVAYYATPYEVVTKLLLIPTAVVGVMFPAFSVSFVEDRGRAAALYRRSVTYTVLGLLPFIVLIVALAQNGLTLWLGAEFARHSTRVAQWLAVGVLANGLALVPFSFVQGVGRPDLTAKLHLVELPVYLGVLFWLIHADGIAGAAIAWSGRTVVDALALFLIARRFLPAGAPIGPHIKGLVAAGMLRRDKIAAVVVTYHPDDSLPQRMQRLAHQVGACIIVDNHSGDAAVAMLRGIASRQGATLLLNPENVGIAAALNIGVETAIADGYEWALLLDQDTVVGEDLVETLAGVYEEFADKERLALIGSNHTDPISGRPFLPSRGDDHGSWQEVKAAITSGSLLSLAVYRAIGPFREEFFIDCVDSEYCLRARARGFKVITARKPLMQHSIGTVTMHKLPWKSVGASNHSPLRRYYMTRNQLVLAREYLWKEPVWTVSTLYAHLKSTIALCVLEKDILRKLQYTAIGAVDGLRSNFSRRLG